MWQVSSASSWQTGDLERSILSMAEVNKIRSEENADVKVNKAENEQGLEDVKMALKVLRDYYSKNERKSSQGGAAGCVLNMLEVVESDFSKSTTPSPVDPSEWPSWEELKSNSINVKLEERPHYSAAHEFRKAKDLEHQRPGCWMLYNQKRQGRHYDVRLEHQRASAHD